MQELVDYIRTQRANGQSDEEIIAALKSVGWDEASITEAIASFNMPYPKPKVVDSVIAEPNFDKYWQKLGKRGRYGIYGLILVAVLVFAGFKAYSYFLSNPNKIWQDSIRKMSNIETAKFKAEISYTDTANNDESEGLGLFGSGEYKFSASGEGEMVVAEDKSDVDYNMTSTLAAKLGSLNISFAFESRKLGDNLYYKMDGNPLVGLFGGSGNKDETKKWIKLNLKDSGRPGLDLNQIQKNQILDALTKARLMRPTKTIGSETIEGTNTWHYEAELDKAAIKNYVKELRKVMGDGQFKDVESIIDKIEFRKLELWIGKSDHRIHQALIETTAPSYVSAVGLTTGPARSKARDAKRLADVNQIRTAMELFYLDNGRYPVSVNYQPLSTDGEKIKLNTYISNFPQAPVPADGKCTEEENKYKYKQLDGGSSYELDFCIGQDTAGYTSGVLMVNPNGIKNISSGGKTDDSVQDPLEGVPFTAVIHLKVNLSDFNSKVEIEEPKAEEVSDVGARSRDARRLADVRQIQTALELFYDDHNNSYPGSSNGQPVWDRDNNYLPAYPKVPSPADGDCKDNDNRYYYEYLNSQQYQLTFCLGNEISGYKAGIHKASSSGID